MGQLARAANTRGGILDRRQIEEVATVTRRVREEFTGWRREIDNATSAVRRLKDEQRQIDSELRSPQTSTSRRMELGDRALSIGDDISAAERRLASLNTEQARVSRLARTAQQHNDSLANVQEAQNGGAGGSGFKKAIGYGAALIGAGTILGFLLESMSKAGAISQGRTGLANIGGQTSFGAGTALGFGPTAELQMAQTVAKRGNYGAGGTMLAMESARAFDMDGAAAANMVGSTGALTGMTQEQTRQYIEAMRDFGKLGKNKIGTRIEEYVNTNQRLIQTISSTSGGAKIGAGSAEFIAGLQASMWGKGPSGQNADILSKLNAGISGGGGSAGQQLFMWNALGGNKLAPGDLGAFRDYRKRTELGIGDSENVRGALNRTSEIFGGIDSPQARLNWDSAFGMTTTQTDTFLDSIKEKIKDKADKDKKSYEQTYAEVMSSPELFKGVLTSAKAAGNLSSDAASGTDAHTKVQADIEKLMVGIGDGMLNVIDPIKAGLTDIANSINGGDFTQAIKDFNRLISGGYGAEALVDKGNKEFRGYEGADWMQSLFFTVSEKTASQRARHSSHDELSGWMQTHNSIGSLNGDYRKLAQYNANLAHLQKEDPEKLKGMTIIPTEQLDALARSIVEASKKMETAATNIELGARLAPSIR
jgi:hypothetical protein